MRIFGWVQSCFGICFLLSATSVFAGIIEQYPLATNAVGLYHPGVYDLIPAGGVTFSGGACGAAADIPVYSIENNCTNANGVLVPNAPLNPSALVAPASLMSAMSGLGAYTIEMDFSAGPGVSTSDLYYDLYDAAYGSQNLCDDGQLVNGDQIAFSVGLPAGYAEVYWILGENAANNTYTLVRTGNVLEYNGCNDLRFVFDGTYYYIFINGILEAGPTTGTSGTGQISTLLLQVTNGGFLYGSGAQGGGWISNVMFANTPLFPGTTTPTITPTMTPSPSPSPSPTATPTPACQTCSNGVARIPQDNGSPWDQVTLPNPPPTGTTTDELLDESPPQDIGYQGCYLTCFAMIAKQTPSQLDTTLTARNDISSNGVLYGDVDAAKYLLGLHLDATPFENDNSDAENLISENVCNPGTYVIVGVQKSTGKHYILVTGQTYDSAMQTCRFSIDDPATPPEQYLDELTTQGYPISDVEILSPQ